MKNRIVWLAAVLLSGFLGICPGYAQEVDNLLVNGGFEDGVLDPWYIYGTNENEIVTELTGATVPEGPIEGIYALHVTVPAAGANYWDTHLKQQGLVFEQGKHYTLSAFFKSKQGTQQFNLKPERDGDPYEGFPEQAFTMTEEWVEYSVTTPVFTETVDPASIAFHLAFEAGDFWVDGIRFYEGDYVAPPQTKPEDRAKALYPDPTDSAPDVANDTTLSWTAGEFAATHDVYLGKNFDDVNDASRINPMDVLVSENQLPTTFQALNPLEFGQTYYWRIDEVNEPPEATVYKGDIWSFTVEPYTYPIENITATASSAAVNQGPENTVNGSGLNANDQHSITPTDMWLSNAAGPQPTWIQYEFDKAYALFEMWVWNSNQIIESSIGFGARDVTIDYSLDGETWTTFDNVEFAQAPGAEGYAHNTTIDMQGIFAQYIRLTINSNWFEILDQYGLSEVRFFQIPVRATNPQPSSGASDVELDVVLDWRAGREAVQHDVFFSSDEQAVIDGTAFLERISDTSYQVGPLEYGQVYYWKINEVNEAASIPLREGDIWEFTTTEYMIVDDFESYSAENPIWESWLDGLGFGSQGMPGFNPGNGTGSAVGDDNTPSFTEETIVHSGAQSMPLFYNNSKQGFASYSETEHALNQTEDWTTGGLTQLSLWFRGYPASVGSFVEAPAGTYTITASGTDITGSSDEFHFAYQVLNGAGSIVAKVESIDNTNEWAKAAVMIRETLDPDSAHAMTFVTPEQGVVFEYRVATGDDNVGAAGQQTGITAPHWVKIERNISGNFTAYQSTDGTSWQILGTPVNIQMSANVYVGLALTSHDTALTCQAVFSNVTIDGQINGQWANQDIGIVSNDPEPVYVGIADAAGNAGVIEHEDPAATQIDTWTQWQVDLAEFADKGVNLATVEKIILGVGNRDNPVAGGSGTLFVDDVAVGNPAPTREVRNLLVNGGFENGILEPWYIYDNTGQGATAEIVGDDPVEGNSCLHVVVPAIGANFYDVGLVQPGLVFEAGKKYTLSAFVKCKEGTLDISFKPEHAADPYEGYGDKVITVTDQWVEYSVTTPVLAADVVPAATTFHIGFATSEFWMDNVRLYEGDYAPPGAQPADDGNKLGHGGFENGTATPLNNWQPLTWSMYGNGSMEVVSEDPIEGDYCLKVTIPTATANIYDVGIKQVGHVLEAGKSYTLSAWMKSKSGPLVITYNLELDEDPYDKAVAQDITISEEWAQYSITTDVLPATIDPAAVTFHVGYAVGEFLVDDVRFYEN